MELFLDDRRADFWLFELLTHVDCDVDCEDPPLPPPLRRESNERYLYFGFFPHACAMVITKEYFDHAGKYVIEEPIAGIKNKDYRVIKADVISKIYLIYHYLELSGLVWSKDKNVITVEIGEEKSGLEIYVCDGMFYILVDPGLQRKLIDLQKCLEIRQL